MLPAPERPASQPLTPRANAHPPSWLLRSAWLRTGWAGLLCSGLLALWLWATQPLV